VTAAKRGENRETVRTFLRWIYNNLLIGTQARGFGFGFTLLLAAYQSQLICTQNRTELNQTKNKKTENGAEVGEHLLRKIIPQLVTFCKIQSRRDRH